MKIRKHLLPRALQDACATAFLFLCIPTTFYFEIWVSFISPLIELFIDLSITMNHILFKF